ncbi:type I restriction-modification system endonuclease [Methylobacter sp. Wu1]|uniref:type I restriction-modification system endonuclease n=1 Tax=Methylobacter sp. Wu1 TaxID=3119359 RepID=UPI002F946849
MNPILSNFDFLKHHDELLVRLAQTAEACFVPDPNTTLIKMRQLGEELAKTIASRVGVNSGCEVKQVDLLRDLDYTLRLDKQVKDAFHALRKLGNPATHDITSSSHRDALKALQVGHALSAWFHTQFGGDKAKGFKLEPFVKPQDPSEKVRQLEQALQELQKQTKTAEDRLSRAEQQQKIEAQKAEAEKQRAEQMASESQVWEQIATEHEAKLTQFRAKMDVANIEYFKFFTGLEKQQQAEQIRRVEKSTLHLNEAETRILIDEQLIEAGWEADSVNLRYSKGARPIANANRAIAEWPTDSGPADYVLFMGLTPVAVVEAKKSAKNVYDDIGQAKRYAKGLQEQGAFTLETNYGEFKVPLTFATNGRPYLKQLEKESGIWFLDVRDNSNRRKVLKGWYTPQEIKTYLRQTPQQAEAELDEMAFDYNLKLRDYQVNAIKAVESSIKQGKNTALIAMATGTGKTKTAIAMVYRLLKSERFRRILFLVDRSALGVQATGDFCEVRLENLNTFADTFDVMGMEQNKPPKPNPEDDTKVHIATVQGVVKRILYPGDNENKPGVGQYDCIVVDECHRGYLLDRELSDTEILFRDQKDYQSKYRAAIDYFDAFKIGLTATPALHTTEIFGPPVFTYSYTEAVLDGYLNDHLPPIRIHTKLAEQGIKYAVNEPVKVYDAENNSIETYNTPDELNFDVADFNRKVIAPEFTKVVTQWLIESDAINPYSPAKTLVFCVTDKHADDVVEAFKAAIETYHGEVEDDAVQKITGTTDKPLDKIRSYKNDRLPNIAVTVDLLTTGVDVPKICNLVFLRRVNSRILFEQMLGRATRLCPEIGKGPFRVYDAVDIYKQLEKVNTMKPVVTNVDISFSDLEAEMTQTTAPDLQDLAKKQFIAKLQVKKNFLTDEQVSKFETLVGKPPADFAKDLKTMPLQQVAQWFTNHPGLGELLDAKLTGADGFLPPIVIHEGEDKITQITTGYGEGQKPQDYLNAFKDFINANSNRLLAIQTVINKPWALSRQSLKELAVELDRNRFREQDLQTAWREVKQEEIAARIIGFIRQAALGEALIPWEQRVDKALEKILNSQPWKTPQREWLQLIAQQMKAATIVDEAALNQGIFKHQGGIKRADKLFEQPVTDVLERFNRALWQ